MEFLIYLNRIYNKYKVRIWTFIIIIALFLLVMYAMDEMQEENGNSSNSNITTISGNAQNNEIYSVVNNVIANDSNNVNEDIETIQTSITSNEQAIEAFVMLCNSGKTDLAYNMLSDDCKEVVYSTKASFVNLYYKSVFNTNKIVDVEEYKEDTYKVTFSDDPLVTGGTTGNNVIDYITVDNGKINISSFVKKEDMDVTQNTSYMKIYVSQKVVYIDYEVYTVSFENYTTVKMSIDILDDGNVYLKNDAGDVFNIVNNDYSESDFYFYPDVEKELTLKFDCEYEDDNGVTTLNFNDIEIENTKYYDETEIINGSSTQSDSTEKVTTYPEQIDIVVTF